tara:strand:- start:155 stop:847 length:693 start_codon:yes stop_codon:yes gene_type:complete
MTKKKQTMQIIGGSSSLLLSKRLLDQFVVFATIKAPSVPYGKLNDTYTYTPLKHHTKSCLIKLNIAYFGELLQWTKQDFAKAPGVGLKTLNEICTLLSSRGMRFRKHDEEKLKYERPKHEILEASTGTLSMTCAELGLSTRAINCLNSAQIFSVRDLTQCGADYVRGCRNLRGISEMGWGSVNEIRKALFKHGLALRNDSTWLIDYISSPDSTVEPIQVMTALSHIYDWG